MAAAARELSAVQREEVAAHLAGCPDCAAEYSLASELRGWAAETAGAAGASNPALVPPRAPSRLRVWLPLAAGIAFLVVGLAVFEQRRPGTRSGEVRGTSAQPTWQVTPLDESRMASPPERLEWTAVADAETYRVVLYDHESRPVWRSEDLQVARAEPPGDLDWSPGRTYYWRVVARRGLTEERSPLFSFRLEP